MTGVEGMATRLEAAQGALMDALDGITEEELHTPPSEGEWTVAEICAHVIEMEPLWAGKAAGIGAASEVGRTPEETERRTAEIALHASDDAAAVQERLAAAGSEALGILRDMGDTGLDASDGTGSLTGRAVIERYLVGHLVGARGPDRAGARFPKNLTACRKSERPRSGGASLQVALPATGLCAG